MYIILVILWVALSALVLFLNIISTEREIGNKIGSLFWIVALTLANPWGWPIP